MAFLYALPGAVAEGLIWGLMAIGIYISYKILDIADLTVDGSICTGACVCAVLLGLGVPAWISVLVALIAGALTGVVTGLLHTMLGIPSILAGILTQLMLYSVNLLILSGKSLMAIDPRANQLLVHMNRNNDSILSLVIIAGDTIFLLYQFFYTEIGLTLKSTGDNPDMSRAQGVDVNRNREYYRDLLKTLDLGLEDRLSTKVGLLSGGQRQAVTLLMASVNKPKLLLLDEHTAAFDPKTAAKVLEITDKIVTENNLTTLAHGNRLIMMQDGHIIMDVEGEEKKKLTVEDLLKLFAQASGREFASDRAILS